MHSSLKKETREIEKELNTIFLVWLIKFYILLIHSINHYGIFEFFFKLTPIFRKSIQLTQ
jgi:hypothetical protein